MKYQGHINDFVCVHSTANRTIYQNPKSGHLWIHSPSDLLTSWPSDIMKDSVKHLTQVCSRDADWAPVADSGHTVGRSWSHLIQYMSHLHQTESTSKKKKTIFKHLIFLKCLKYRMFSNLSFAPCSGCRTLIWSVKEEIRLNRCADWCAINQRASKSTYCQHLFSICSVVI